MERISLAERFTPTLYYHSRDFAGAMTMTSMRLLHQSLLRSATRQSVRSIALRSAARSPLLVSRASAAAARVQPRAQMSMAHFSSDADSQVESLDEGRFLELADGTLHDILDWLDGVEVMLEDSDISFAVGPSNGRDC